MGLVIQEIWKSSIQSMRSLLTTSDFRPETNIAKVNLTPFVPFVLVN